LVVRHADKERAEIDEQLRLDHVDLLRTNDGVLRGLICFRVELDVCSTTPAIVLQCSAMNCALGVNMLRRQRRRRPKTKQA
jgi:hypothetical protein